MVATLKVDRIETVNDTGTITIPTGVKLAGTDIGSVYSPGSIVQVQNTILTTTGSFTAAQNVLTDVPGLSVDITPRFNNSKMYITARWFGELSANGTWNCMWNIRRNGTAIGPSATAKQGIHMASTTYESSNYASTPELLSMDYMDTPGTTNTLTYQVCAVNTGTAGNITIYVNRTVSVDEEGTCSITVMEIAQ